eukprot:3731307-Rhodomonas_salina.1
MASRHGNQPPFLLKQVKWIALAGHLGTQRDRCSYLIWGISRLARPSTATKLWNPLGIPRNSDPGNLSIKICKNTLQSNGSTSS